jgi:hypothetical protein
MELALALFRPSTVGEAIEPAPWCTAFITYGYVTDSGGKPGTSYARSPVQRTRRAA